MSFVSFKIGTLKPVRSGSITIEGNNRRFTSFDSESVRPRKNNTRNKLEERITEINFNFKNEVILREARLTTDAKYIQIIGFSSALSIRPEVIVPDSFEFLTFYERKRKRKILNYFCMKDGSPQADIQWLLARHQFLYAIDTNTIHYKDVGRVSIATVLEVRIKDIGMGYSASDFKLFYTEAYVGVSNNPELYAIKQLVEKIRGFHQPTSGMHIGIVTDTALSEIRSINLRETPLSEAYYLPYGFHLSYASDASGAEEYLPNRLIRECENNSRRRLKELETLKGWRRVA